MSTIGTEAIKDNPNWQKAMSRVLFSAAPAPFAAFNSAKSKVAKAVDEWTDEESASWRATMDLALFGIPVANDRISRAVIDWTLGSESPSKKRSISTSKKGTNFSPYTLSDKISNQDDIREEDMLRDMLYEYYPSAVEAYKKTQENRFKFTPSLDRQTFGNMPTWTKPTLPAQSQASPPQPPVSPPQPKAPATPKTTKTDRATTPIDSPFFGNAQSQQ